MSWETRGGTAKYYTRSLRRDGRVIREYFGGGPAGELAYRMDEATRASGIAQREAFAADRTAVIDADVLTRTAYHEAKAALMTAMGAAGYRLHGRSTWRRTRVKKPRTGSRSKRRQPDAIDRLLLDGDPGDSAPTTEELRRFLAGEPPRPAAGDLTGQAEAAWLGLIAGTDDAYRRALAEGLAGFKVRLAGETPAEWVLVEQCGLAWLEAEYFAARAAQTAGENLSVQHRKFLLEGADRASRRLALLVKQLAAVRVLLGRAGGGAGGSGAKRGGSGRPKPAGRGARSGTGG